MITYDNEGSIIGSGTNISVGGKEWVGITQIHTGWWMAYRADDDKRKLFYVQED